jgi:hypothetical protein
MTFRLDRVEYFHASVPEEAGEACRLLAGLARLGVNLLAFSAVPTGAARTQLTLVPEDPGRLASEGGKAGVALDGPHPAFLARGDDELGALAQVHERLEQAGVDVYATSGVADGRGGFGYVIYVRPSAFPRAVAALGL